MTRQVNPGPPHGVLDILRAMIKRGLGVALGAAMLWTGSGGEARADDSSAAGGTSATVVPATTTPAQNTAQPTGTAPADGSGAAAQAGAAEWGGFYDGRTLGSGGGALIAEAGWPFIGAGVLFGVADPVDLGVELAGTPNGLGTYATEVGGAFAFGMEIRAVGRFALVKGDTVSFVLRVEPGFRFSAFDPQVAGGLLLDVAGDVGIHVMKGGTVYAGLEVPLFFGVVNFGGNVPVHIPILPGAGFEYHVNDFIGVGGRFNAGPAIAVANGATATSFAFIGEGFFILRWDRLK
jgi:hypothetical protein